MSGDVRVMVIEPLFFTVGADGYSRRDLECTMTVVDSDDLAEMGALIGADTVEYHRRAIGGKDFVILSDENFHLRKHSFHLRYPTTTINMDHLLIRDLFGTVIVGSLPEDDSELIGALSDDDINLILSEGVRHTDGSSKRSYDTLGVSTAIGGDDE